MHNRRSTFIMDKKNCVFCSLFTSKTKEVLYESQNFRVIAGVGAFSLGYLMVIPKEHILSFAAIKEEQMQELLEVIADMRYLLKQIYGEPVAFWENGSGQTARGKSKNSIVHAHGHLLPINAEYDIVKDVNENGVTLERLNITELHKYVEKPYLLISTPTNNEWYIKSDSYSNNIPRQFIRRLLYNNLVGDGEKWNWRLYPFEENVQNTEFDFKEYVTANFSKLPKRIQMRLRCLNND